LNRFHQIANTDTHFTHTHTHTSEQQQQQQPAPFNQTKEKHVISDELLEKDPIH
jgi:hypothetical protein